MDTPEDYKRIARLLLYSMKNSEPDNIGAHSRRTFLKSLGTGAGAEEAFADKHGENVTPYRFWRNRTQTVVGMDDQPVHKTACNPARLCFEE